MIKRTENDDPLHCKIRSSVDIKILGNIILSRQGVEEDEEQ